MEHNFYKTITHAQTCHVLTDALRPTTCVTCAHGCCISPYQRQTESVNLWDLLMLRIACLVRTWVRWRGRTYTHKPTRTLTLTLTRTRTRTRHRILAVPIFFSRLFTLAFNFNFQKHFFQCFNKTGFSRRYYYIL